MMATRANLEQMRLDRCVLDLPKWTKIPEKFGKCACRALKIDELAPNDADTIENDHQNGQTNLNNALLGKYRLINTRSI